MSLPPETLAIAGLVVTGAYYAVYGLARRGAVKRPRRAGGAALSRAKGRV